jgi:hypothetical protein
MLVPLNPQLFFSSEKLFRANAHESSTVLFFTTTAVQRVVSDKSGTT